MCPELMTDDSVWVGVADVGKDERLSAYSSAKNAISRVITHGTILRRLARILLSSV